MCKYVLCTDCNRLIDGKKIKGMRCKVCGKPICYKCNITYCCKSCYTGLRNDYYNEKKIEGDIKC